MRGHGAVNTRCAVEVGMDELAEQLAVDPIDLRLANLLPPHCRTITGFRITSNGMREALTKVREGSDWDNKFRKLPLQRELELVVVSSFLVLAFLFTGIQTDSLTQLSTSKLTWMEE